MFGEKLKTNIDTDFLKIIAIISMFIDHIGMVFFPQYYIFRWIGRIAFPIFCYCMTVGVLYTNNVKSYILRLVIFAFISQPFYLLAFYYNNILGNIFKLNIFFTLILSFIGIWSFKEKKVILFIVINLLLITGYFDYGNLGLIFMLVFYIFRNKPIWGMFLYIIIHIPYFIVGNFQFGVGVQAFAIFALPLIYIKTNTCIRLPKMFFYVFYPAHLLLIFILRIVIGI